MTARWWSQPFSAAGGAAAEGIAKQLGKPLHDPLTIMVREAAQNSWDARCSTDPVEFTIRVERLGDRASLWRSHLGSLEPEAQVDIGSALQEQSPMVIVSDRRTRGLGGPLRADVKPGPGEIPNFVQFLRNVGEPSDQKFGGGTYGFGKGSLYEISGVKGILVDSRCTDGGPGSRRLMGSVLGRSFYDTASRRFTGRHWWGNVGADDVPDPLLDDEAASVAGQLGLPGFDDGATGTDIVVLAAMLGEDEGVSRSNRDAASLIVSTLLWHLWPKMGSKQRDRRMRFRVFCDGRELPVPDPQKVPELAGFVRALDTIHRGEGRPSTRKSKPKHVGDFAAELVESDPSARDPKRDLVMLASPIEPPFRFVARMRQAELVVDYWEGSLHPDPLFGYCGVFRASEEADQVFADSEPPTHDAWVSAGLRGTALGVVRDNPRFLREAIEGSLGISARGIGRAVGGLGHLASELSSLIPTASGLGPGGGDEGPGGPGGGLGGRGPKKARLLGDPRVEVYDSGPVVVADVELPANPAAFRVRAEAAVVVEGGALEAERPAGARQPAVLGWRPPDDPQRWVEGESLELPPGGTGGTAHVYVTFVQDAAVKVRIEQLEADA